MLNAPTARRKSSRSLCLRRFFPHFRCLILCISSGLLRASHSRNRMPIPVFGISPGLLRASHSRNPATEIRKSSRSLRSRDFFAHFRCQSKRIRISASQLAYSDSFVLTYALKKVRPNTLRIKTDPSCAFRDSNPGHPD